jgi:SAM-dependent methyltransferase
VERLARLRLDEERALSVDWQDRYEAGDTPWDKGEAHPALIDFVAEQGPLQGRVLVPGCGLGHDVRALSTGENAVTGLDIAPSAVEAARQFPPTGREEYIAGDLFDLDAPLRRSFSWVVEHTCFCAIDPAMRGDYPAAVAGALVPHGLFLAVFFRDPGVEEGPPFGVTVSELDRLFGPWFEVMREWVPGRTYEGREARELVRLCRLRDGLHL